MMEVSKETMKSLNEVPQKKLILLNLSVKLEIGHE